MVKMPSLIFLIIPSIMGTISLMLGVFDLAVTLSENDTLIKEYFSLKLPIITFIKTKLLLVCLTGLLLRIIFVDIKSIFTGKSRSHNYFGIISLSILPFVLKQKFALISLMSNPEWIKLPLEKEMIIFKLYLIVGLTVVLLIFNIYYFIAKKKDAEYDEL